MPAALPDEPRNTRITSVGPGHNARWRTLAFRHIESLAHIALIVLVGLAYRATFITQGFNATDEGWLQSVGRRITLGQVPYRDFRFAFPPVSIYKEAALEAVFGDAYTLLFSRWVFVAEATIGSVIAYLIIKRFFGPRFAVLAVLPTLFFSVLNYYFSNYTYDADVLAIASMLLIIFATRDRRWPSFASGSLASLAALAKPNYAGLVVLIPAIALLGSRLMANRDEIHPALHGIYRQWPNFLAGAGLTLAVVLALFAAAGAAGAFIDQSFLGAIGALPHGAGFAIWQDLPTAFRSRELKLFGLVFLLILLTALPALKRVSWIAALGIPLGLYAYSYRYVQGDQGFIPMAMGLLLIANGAGLLISLAVRTRKLGASQHAMSLRNRLPMPEVFVLAIALQYLAQFTFSGIAYSYLGAFLSLPTAILSLYALSELSPSRLRRPTRFAFAAIAPALFGVWMVLMSINYVQHEVYFDTSRAELTGAFQAPKLAGITSSPANVRRVDGVLALVARYSKPGDPILAMPDFACVYFLTDRVNPTSQDWYLISDARFVPSSEVDSVLRELHARPPKVVILQTVTEFDWSRSHPPVYAIDYRTSKLMPIYDYLSQRYITVATVDDIQVLIARDAPSA